MASALLLGALGQPAWALAHVAVHAHLAQHHGEATPHPPASAPDPHESETRPLASPERSHDHDHEHEHLVAVFLRPTRTTDSPSLAALPSPTPCPHVVATRRWQIFREAPPSRASPEASGPSDPRAPPIA
jgi:hypothetical protein